MNYRDSHNVLAPLRLRLGNRSVIGPTRLRILDLIKHNYCISYRDLARANHCNLNAVKNHIKALVEMGLVSYEAGRARTYIATCTYEPIEGVPHV